MQYTATCHLMVYVASTAKARNVTLLAFSIKTTAKQWPQAKHKAALHHTYCNQATLENYPEALSDFYFQL